MKLFSYIALGLLATTEASKYPIIYLLTEKIIKNVIFNRFRSKKYRKSPFLGHLAGKYWCKAMFGHFYSNHSHFYPNMLKFVILTYFIGWTIKMKIVILNENLHKKMVILLVFKVKLVQWSSYLVSKCVFFASMTNFSTVIGHNC